MIKKTEKEPNARLYREAAVFAGVDPRSIARAYAAVTGVKKGAGRQCVARERSIRGLCAVGLITLTERTEATR